MRNLPSLRGSGWGGVLGWSQMNVELWNWTDIQWHRLCQLAHWKVFLIWRWKQHVDGGPVVLMVLQNYDNIGFYARQLYRQVLLRARISYGNSVRLSVRPSRPGGIPSTGEIETPYGNLEYLVSYEVIWCQLVKRFPSNEGIKEGYPLRNHYFTTIGSSSVKTVADRHRLPS